MPVNLWSVTAPRLSLPIDKGPVVHPPLTVSSAPPSFMRACVPCEVGITGRRPFFFGPNGNAVYTRAVDERAGRLGLGRPRPGGGYKSGGKLNVPANLVRMCVCGVGK